MLHTFSQHLVNAKALCACAAVLALGGVTLSANADPGHGGVIVTGGVRVVDRCAPSYYRNPRVIVHGADCSCPTCFAKHEYERGFNRGEAFGSNAGYRDGLSGDRFCPESRDELCDNSRPYRDGYFAAFGNGYRAGFEKGRADRACAASCNAHPSRNSHVAVNVWGRW